MSKIDISKPRWSQDTYWGRAKHFAVATNPLNLLATNSQLQEAKEVVETFKKTRQMPAGYDEEKLWRAKYLYESAYHPDTGEKLILIGRMSAQMPCNTFLCAGMITFYKTTAQTVFWQWANQTFNAVVNYSNRSGDADIPMSTVVGSYICACSGALGTAIYLNSRVKYLKNPLYARLVPFAAVCGANFINIPFMRSTEIVYGTPVYTSQGDRIGDSKVAARLGVFLVCISRISMVTPTLTLVPALTNYGTLRGWFRKRPWTANAFQVGMVALCVLVGTPLGCALFPQQASLPTAALDSHLIHISNPLYARLVPFAAVCGANFINIPFMRSNEIRFGTPVFTHQGVRLGESSVAARYGVLLVIISRIIMSFPTLSFVPMVTNYGIKKGWFNKNPRIIAPFQTVLVGICALCATPLACAIFSQQAEISVDAIESDIARMSNPLFARLVPFAAVCGANCINIPFMRSSELLNGTPVFSPDGERLGDSTAAARLGVLLVIVSRTIMSIPTLTIAPMITNFVTNKGWFNKAPRALMPFQTAVVAVCALFATPFACALFSQQTKLPVEAVESEIGELAKKKGVQHVVFNKGL